MKNENVEKAIDISIKAKVIKRRIALLEYQKLEAQKLSIEHNLEHHQDIDFDTNVFDVLSQENKDKISKVLQEVFEETVNKLKEEYMRL